jgi:hypothetical protein
MACGNFNNINLLNSTVDFNSIIEVGGKVLVYDNVSVMFLNRCGTDTINPEKNNNISILYAKDIKVLSNRVYTVWVNFFDNNKFFRKYDNNNMYNNNVIRITPYLTDNNNNNLTITGGRYYKQPAIVNEGVDNNFEYYNEQYSDTLEGYDGIWNYYVQNISDDNVSIDKVYGSGYWRRLKCQFKIEDNSGSAVIGIKIDITTSDSDGFNFETPLFFNNFGYYGRDIVTQDPAKSGGVIETLFDESFRGGIQKLRVYDKALNSQEVLHNAVVESKTNPFINVNKGGRIISRL